MTRPRPSSQRASQRASHRVRSARTRARSGAGYTIVELVMAMGIFAVGVTGVAAMQTATSASNRHAKNLAIANSIAKTWQEELAVDALRWTDLPASLATTTWIKDQATPIWMLPPATATMGPSFDAQGNFIADPTAASFCVHTRLTPLMQTPGSGLVRAEVRVFWPRAGHAWEGGANFCTALPATFRAFDVPATASAGDTEVDNFHFVYATSAVRQTPGEF